MYINLMIGLALVAVVFVLWPLFRVAAYQKKGVADANVQDATQAILFNEHLADLDKSLAAGELDEAQHTALKVELQRTLIADAGTGLVSAPVHTGGVWLLVLGAVLMPLLAFGFYSHWGAQAEWELSELLKQQRQINPENQQEYDRVTKILVVKAKQLVETKPKSSQWLYLLASYAMSTQDLNGAETYYRKLLALEPRSPQVMAELAQTLFVKAQNQVTPEVHDLVEGSLKIAPNMPSALSLAGIDSFQHSQFRAAIDYWTRALQFLDPQTTGSQALQGGIEKAKQSLQAAGETLEAPAVVAADGPAVDIEVSVAPGLNVAPEDSVFVYARAWQGAKMPLAIQRFKVADLPKKVRLDKSMAMAPGMDLSSAPTLELVARISKTGSAITASGDWQAAQGPVTLAELAGPVALVIEQQVP